MTIDIIRLRSPEFFQDPYSTYRQFRDEGRPAWVPHQSRHTTTSGTWLFFNHDDVSRLIQDAQSVSHEIRNHRTPGSENFYDFNMLLRDADDHQRLRKLVSEFFSTQFLKGFSATILEIANQHLDVVEGKETFNLVEDFAAVVPLKVMARMLGTPETDAVMLRAWTLDLHDMSDSLLDLGKARRHVLRDLYEYVAAQYMDDRESSDDDTVIAKLRQGERTGAISRPEALAMLALLLVAGNATVTALLSTTLWLLLTHPEQMEQLRSNPDLLDQTIEETLRFESPVQRTIFRITTDVIELDRFRLEKGQQFSLVVGSAHRDETAFSRPDVFDITRSGKSHLAFGRGVHTCLGKHLALIEARVMLRALLERFPDIALQTPQAVWRPNSMFRELRDLSVHAGLRRVTNK